MKIDPQVWLEQKDGDSPLRVFPTVRTCQLLAPTPFGIVCHWTELALAALELRRGSAR